MQVLKDWRLYVAGKTVGGQEFQSLDVIGINELANLFYIIKFYQKKKNFMTLKVKILYETTILLFIRLEYNFLNFIYFIKICFPKNLHHSPLTKLVYKNWTKLDRDVFEKGLSVLGINNQITHPVKIIRDSV